MSFVSVKALFVAGFESIDSILHCSEFLYDSCRTLYDFDEFGGSRSSLSNDRTNDDSEEAGCGCIGDSLYNHWGLFPISSWWGYKGIMNSWSVETMTVQDDIDAPTFVYGSLLSPLLVFLLHKVHFFISLQWSFSLYFPAIFTKYESLFAIDSSWCSKYFPLFLLHSIDESILLSHLSIYKILMLHQMWQMTKNQLDVWCWAFFVLF